MSLLYEAHNLVKRYGDIVALSLPFFHVAEGEAVVITGPNGSGKSTLLRLLAFLEEPTSGELKYLHPCGNPRLEATLMLQEPFLLRENIFRNVVLGLRLRGVKENLREIYENSMRAVGFYNPAELAKRKPHALSGGQKQRVSLASRLAINPVALLLDEPTAYVDSASADAIVAALSSLLKQGASIVCATHDTSIADRLGARSVSL